MNLVPPPLLYFLMILATPLPHPCTPLGDCTIFVYRTDDRDFVFHLRAIRHSSMRRQARPKRTIVKDEKASKFLVDIFVKRGLCMISSSLSFGAGWAMRADF